MRALALGVSLVVSCAFFGDFDGNYRYEPTGSGGVGAEAGAGGVAGGNTPDGWALAVTATTAATVYDVIALQGGMVVAGSFEGDDLQIGEFPCTPTCSSAGSTDMFVARLDDSGMPQWIRSFGAAGSDEALDLAAQLDPERVLVVGKCTGEVTFGTTTVGDAANFTGCLAQLDAENGDPLDAAQLGGGSSFATSVAWDGSRMWVTGTTADWSLFEPSAGCACPYAFPSTGQQNDIFVIALSTLEPPDCPVRCGFQSSLADTARAIAPDGAQGAYLVGQYGDNIQFGPTFLTTHGASDAFAIRLDADGNVAAAREFAGTGVADDALDVMVDSDGPIIVGAISEEALLGGDMLPDVGLSGFVTHTGVQLSSDLWHHVLGNNTTDGGAFVVARAVTQGNGNTFVVGEIAANGSSYDFAGDAVIPSGGKDIFVFVVGATQDTSVLTIVGTGGQSVPRAVAIHGAEALAIVGSFHQSLSPPSGEVSCPGSACGFIMSLSSTETAF